MPTLHEAQAGQHQELKMADEMFAGRTSSEAPSDQRCYKQMNIVAVAVINLQVKAASGNVQNIT